MKRFWILFFALCFFSRLTCQDLTWSSPVSLSSSSVDGSDPRIVIDANGNAIVAWVESGLIKAKVQPVGGSWGTIATLSSSGASAPRLGVDGSGNVTAIWLQGDVVTAARLPSGGSWSSAIALSGSGASAPQLAVDSAGNAVAIWARNGFIESSTRTVALGLWSLVATLSTSGSDAPQVAISANGTIIAVWHNLTTGMDTIQSSTALIAGVWTAPKMVLNASVAMHHHYPKVAIDADGNAIVTWFRYNLNGSAYTFVQVLSATLTNGASAWGGLATLSQGGLRNPADLALTIGFDRLGNALALWTNSYDGFTFTLESSEKPTGGSWTDISLPTNPSIYNFQSDFSINALSNALAVYMLEEGDVNIYALEAGIADPLPGVWTNAMLISQNSENGFPRVAYTLSGSTANAVAVWISNNGTNNEIVAATGSKTVVAPPTNLAVTQDANDRGVFVEYSNTITWDASVSANITYYNIYRNGVYFAQVDSLTFTFTDHNNAQNGAVTYGVAAFDASGSQSSVATVNFP